MKLNSYNVIIEHVRTCKENEDRNNKISCICSKIKECHAKVWRIQSSSSFFFPSYSPARPAAFIKPVIHQQLPATIGTDVGMTSAATAEAASIDCPACHRSVTIGLTLQSGLGLKHKLLHHTYMVGSRNGAYPKIDKNGWFMMENP